MVLRGELSAARELAGPATLALLFHALLLFLPLSGLKGPRATRARGPITVVVGMTRAAKKAAPAPALKKVEPVSRPAARPVRPEPEPLVKKSPKRPEKPASAASAKEEMPASPAPAAAPRVSGPREESGQAGAARPGDIGDAGKPAPAARPAARARPEGSDEGSAVFTLARPNYLVNPSPPYPPSARRRGYQGTVLLAVSVSSEGRPTGVEIAGSSGHSSLDRAALNAVKKWVFTPAKRGKRPVASRVQVPVTFRLSK